MAIPLLQDERIDIDAVEGAGEVDDLKAGGFCQLARPSPLLGLASGREQRRQIDPHLPHAIRSPQPLDAAIDPGKQGFVRSEEHTSELQSLMRISYAAFCLK